MKEDVCNIEHRDDPRVLVRGDTPFLAHAGCICISDIPTVEIRHKVERTEPEEQKRQSRAERKKNKGKYGKSKPTERPEANPDASAPFSLPPVSTL